MKDKDFRVGDKVYSLSYGNGIVYNIDKENGYPIRVYFSNFSKSYLLDGREYKDTIISLFHGHDLEVIVKEVKPIRSKWVNLYWDKKDGRVVGFSYYKTKEVAFLSRSDKDYLTTTEVLV